MSTASLVKWLAGCALGGLVCVSAACGSGPSGSPAGSGAKPPAEADAAVTDDDALPPPAFETELPEGVRSLVARRSTGDLDEMAARRMIRLGVTFNRTFYFVDNGAQRGASYEMGKAFEDEINRRLKTGNKKIHVIFVPVPRDQLLPALLDGRVDAVLAQLTVTPERQKLVDFSRPTRSDVNEVVVTGPGTRPLGSVEELSGRRVYVRRTSSYHQSLIALNARLTGNGKPPVDIQEASGNLEDDDLIEMVNAGLLPATVVDDYLAAFWKKIFPGITVSETAPVRTGGALAVAVRKNSPRTVAAINAFLSKYGLGSAFGNTIEKRYLVSTGYARRATSEADRQKFLGLVGLFRKYGDQYRLDFLLMAAQAYQESGLDHSARSRVGAIGIMQVMPATGADMKVGDIKALEPNIHAGVKYVRFMQDQYFKDEPMDALNKGLFTFAAYNAGPGKIRQLRKEAAKRGLDPNVWFGNVEQIASERIGRETVTYVSNIYKYYIAYRLLSEERDRRDAARAALKAPGSKQGGTR